MDIDLKELSEKSSRSELELAKFIIQLLAMKAEVTGVPQHVVCCFGKRKVQEDAFVHGARHEFKDLYYQGVKICKKLKSSGVITA